MVWRHRVRFQRLKIERFRRNLDRILSLSALRVEGLSQRMESVEGEFWIPDEQATKEAPTDRRNGLHLAAGTTRTLRYLCANPLALGTHRKIAKPRRLYRRPSGRLEATNYRKRRDADSSLILDRLSSTLIQIRLLAPAKF